MQQLYYGRFCVNQCSCMDNGDCDPRNGKCELQYKGNVYSEKGCTFSKWILIIGCAVVAVLLLVFICFCVACCKRSRQQRMQIKELTKGIFHIKILAGKTQMKHEGVQEKEIQLLQLSNVFDNKSLGIEQIVLRYLHGNITENPANLPVELPYAFDVGRSYQEIESGSASQTANQGYSILRQGVVQQTDDNGYLIPAGETNKANSYQQLDEAVEDPNGCSRYTPLDPMTEHLQSGAAEIN